MPVARPACVLDTARGRARADGTHAHCHGRLIVSTRRLFTAWTVLAASLVLSLTIGLGAYVAIQQRLQARFDSWVDNAAGRLRSRLAAHEALVRGAAALFAASEGPVSRAGFREYVGRLDLATHYPGLRAIGYVALVAPHQRKVFLATMRGEVADFALWPEPSDRPVAAVTYVEPFDARNQAVLGFDMLSEPLRAATLEAARDSGEPVLSGRVQLKQPEEFGDSGPAGFVLVFPLYADGELPRTLAERRARLIGYVVAPFGAKEFFGAVLERDLQAPIAMRVHDGPAGAELIFQELDDDTWDTASMVASREIRASGRRWTLEAASRPALVGLHERLLAPVVTAGGIALSFLLFGLIRAQARARATAETTIDALRRGDEARAALLAIERTARREAQELVAALERSNRELDQFAYVASHDLKSPLRGIANLATWIEEDLAEAATPETRHNLELLRGRVRRLEALIDGILSYSRAGRTGDSPEPVDVGALVREVVGLLAPPQEATFAYGQLPVLHTERVPLEQIFMNLIGNAVKYAGKTDVHVAIEGRETPAGWELSVIDDGPGIAAEYHERVWQMFQTLHTRDQVESTGIGLAVVKKIVEARGGTVRLESEPGRGTRVSFTWPARRVSISSQLLGDSLDLSA
jgi:signal transduction histidine kinase